MASPIERYLGRLGVLRPAVADAEALVRLHEAGVREHELAMRLEQASEQNRNRLDAGLQAVDASLQQHVHRLRGAAHAVDARDLALGRRCPALLLRRPERAVVGRVLGDGDPVGAAGVELLL